jgi:hypothetical protein
MPPESDIDKIKSWLKEHGRDRYWLAERLSVNKRTVDNWLSAGQPIPEAKLTLIKRLMEDDEADALRRKQQLSPVAQVFSLEVDLPTFRAYSAAAKAQHLTIEEWCIAELNIAADEWFAQGQPPSLKPQAPSLPPQAPSPHFPAFATSILQEEPEPAKPFSSDELALLEQAAAQLAADNPVDSADSATAHRTPEPAPTSAKPALPPPTSKPARRS